MTTHPNSPAKTGSDSAPRIESLAARVCRFVRFDGHRSGPVLDSTAGGLIVSSHPSNPVDSEHPLARCVILVSPGEMPPQPLLDLLRDHSPDSEHLISAEHPLLALARLARLERDRRIRAETLDGEWPPARPEKSILVVVNRDAWRDLNPLFSTIRELMPAVGIWVCTERIAIEISAGEPGLEQPAIETPGTANTSSERTVSATDTAMSSAGIDDPETPSHDELTEAELRDLLSHFDEPEDEFDDFDGDLPVSDHGGRPPS